MPLNNETQTQNLLQKCRQRIQWSQQTGRIFQNSITTSLLFFFLKKVILK